MTPENYRRAIASLREWTQLPPVKGHPHVNGNRVIATIGGNPCLSLHFEEYCKILKEEIPDKAARGLWSEDIRGYGKLVKETFGFFNLNVHSKAGPAAVMKQELPGVNILGVNRRSIHGGLFTAIQDFVGTPEVPDEAAMWRRIESCDVNKNWSGTIMPFDLPEGSQVIKAYFCEIAAVLERIQASIDEAAGKQSWGPVNGLDVTPGWWRQTMANPIFDQQHRVGCPECGVTMRVRGHEDLEFTDDISKTHEQLIPIAIKRRQGYKLHGESPRDRAVEWTDYVRLRHND